MSIEKKKSSYETKEEAYPSETYFDDSRYSVEITGKDVVDIISNPEIMNSIKDITNNVCSTVLSWKEIERDMHLMDVKLESFLAEMDYNLSKYTLSVPVVEKQLNFVNEKISQILDHVLKMNAETENEINMKMRMLSMAEDYLDKLSAMMIKLL